MSLFITGTATGVGKTRVAAMLVRMLRAAGVDAVGFKPICCSGCEDALAFRCSPVSEAELFPRVEA